MEPLSRTFKNTLEKTVQQARETAEEGARAAVEQIGVGDASPPDFLSSKQRDLRRRLRIHARQLGDRRDSRTEVQEIDLLIEEVAYEHWHRMLFARFLAENNLLMHPGAPPVAVTLEECNELAAEECAKDGWELASRFAAQMLPQIFRPDSPVFEVDIPPESQHRLQSLVAELPIEVFHASDSIGWFYQYWQSKRKYDINSSAVKIGARELPAVTQLFTEPYMVEFLLDNSLGAWWATGQLTGEDLYTAKSEAELRSRAAIPGVPLRLLRFVQGDNGAWLPASVSYHRWPDSLSDMKVLDPCCGSGHFLVAAFLMLVPMRMNLEGLSVAEAVDRVLIENLHGLEIDRRCIELAAFSLALAAWRYPGSGGYRKLPDMNLACSGQSVNVNKADWVAFGAGSKLPAHMLEDLYELFKDAPILGSLIAPDSLQEEVPIFGAQMDELQHLLPKLFTRGSDDEEKEMGVAARGISQAALLLAKKYHLVITNVPYLKRSKQNQLLRDFCKRYHSDAKEDLATVFLDRCLSLCTPGGTACIVLPQNWLFLTSYRKFRERLLRANTWDFIARLGPKAFQTQMWDFNVQLLSITRGRFGEADNFRNTISGIDVSDYPSFSEKEENIGTAQVARIEQEAQFKNPDSAIQFEETEETARLSEYAYCYQGSGLADIARFRRYFWEVTPFAPDWVLHQSSPSGETEYSGLKFITLWEDGKGALAKSPQVTIRGRKAWRKKGVACAWMGSLPASLYGGWLYDNSAAVIVPNDQKNLAALWCYCSSPRFNEDVRAINQKLQVANATMVKVPFDLDYWTGVATERYPGGLPRAYSNDPTEWVFHGHPCGAVVWDDNKKRTTHGALRKDASVLQIAVARLLGYRWPGEVDETLELSDEQREWVDRCGALRDLVDEDGIVCIPAVRGEASAADRLYALLAASYGPEWSSATLTEILRHADYADRPLEGWLREKFFTQHCQLFQQRPFIWHIWDGLRDGFGALVNYHKFDRKLLQTLIYTYLGDWINRQTQEINAGIDGAQEKVSAAEQLKRSLELILEGDAPCDIFVRWKSLEQQPVGWNPDLNDGVRLNIRPFLSVPDVDKKGAGVLRDKPNIHWKNDRGRDVESGPWYEKFGGERLNDYHLTLAEKKKALASLGASGRA